MTEKNIPLAVSLSVCPELMELVAKGHKHRFFPQHNGSLFCAEKGRVYDIDDLDFYEVSVTAPHISLFKVKAPDGTRGFVLQRRIH